VSGSNYQVQYSSDLLTTGWTNLGAAVRATNSTTTVFDTIGSSRRFYRVLLTP